MPAAKPSPDAADSSRPMCPEALRAAGERLYGRWGWQTRLALELRVDGSTVRRWVAGKVPVPAWATVTIGLLLRVQELEQELQRLRPAP